MPAPPPQPLSPPCLPRPSHIHSSSTCTDDDDLSSDEDEAIFFGAHKPEEAHLVAKLSAAIQTTAPFIPRVKKRDSREFLRRKTLLLPADKRNHESLSLSAQDSARLYQSQLSDDEESCSTPVRFAHPASIPTPSQMGQDPSDLTLKFETWHLSTPRDDESESAEEGSDKENVPIPPISGAQGAAETVSFQDLGMERHCILDLQGGDDDIPQLNMGGLKLSDFADQESGVIFQGLDILDEFHLEDVTENVMAQPAESPNHNEPARPSTPLPSDESEMSDFDSPLEVARAGPVAIPVLSPHHFTSIRAHVGSPCRSLPPSPIIISAPIAQECTSVKLANLESPTHQSPRLSITTPSRVTALPPADLVQRGAKTLKASTIKHAPAAAAADTKKAAALKSAIRGQLDSAVLARINNQVASTQKNVSGSHTSSSSSLGTSKMFSENSSIEMTENKSKQGLPLQPRPEPRLVRKPIAKPTAAVPLLSSSSTVNRTIPRPALLPCKTSLPRPKSTLPTKTTSMLPPPSSIPLKRPASSQTNITSTSTRHTTTIPQSTTRPSHAHSSVITIGKPLLGQPGRVFRETSTPLQVAPVFSVGVGVGDHSSTMSMSRIARKSPAKQNLFKKPLGENHTPRKLGTPMRFGTPRQGQGRMLPLSIGVCCPLPPPPLALAPAPTPTPLSASAHAPITTISANTAPKENRPPPVSNVAGHEDSPPASHTRHAEEAAAAAILTSPSSSSRTSTRSSHSESQTDHHHQHQERQQHEVSPPTSSSPSPQRPARSKRSTLTKSAAAKPPSSKRPNPKSPKSTSASASASASATTPSLTPFAAPALTEKQLKTTTARNTARNQVYHCAIDRKVIRQRGPRPPSPTSKIRTTSEREEADKKMSREARAKRRRGIHSDEMMDGKQQVVEKLEVAKAPGDEDDWTYKTPRRPLKRARRTSEADEHDDHDHGEEEKKKLRWDRVVSVIRDDGNASGSAKSSDDGKEKDGEELKSCIKTKVPLDEHGNVLDAQRPVDNLKRTRVVVTAVFYDGEEPVPAPATATRSKKK
ncbi:uncharacterized protein IAS62_006080 [Cryptococcus decagattii]|uniref:Uncharacterized protein n=1 Tax=Cryptococcus decagattii TaxID=1859122 RepID=A0ABZ2B1P0_9TREE